MTRQILPKILGTVFLLTLMGCGTGGRMFPDYNEPGAASVGRPPAADVPAAIRQPVLPEMLTACKGHVLVPALGMRLVPRGAMAPAEGQFLREERLVPPYRILPPGARLSNEINPARLNIEIDSTGRIIGLSCG